MNAEYHNNKAQYWTGVSHKLLRPHPLNSASRFFVHHFIRKEENLKDERQAELLCIHTVTDFITSSQDDFPGRSFVRVFRNMLG